MLKYIWNKTELIVKYQKGQQSKQDVIKGAMKSYFTYIMFAILHL